MFRCTWSYVGNRWRQGHGWVTLHSKLQNSYLLPQRAPGVGETVVKVVSSFSQRWVNRQQILQDLCWWGRAWYSHRSYRTTPIGPSRRVRRFTGMNVGIPWRGTEKSLRHNGCTRTETMSEIYVSNVHLLPQLGQPEGCFKWLSTFGRST